MYQLRNAINRVNVVQKPLDRFDTCEDFLVMVVECHISAAAMTMLDMKSLDDVPSLQYAAEGADTWMLPATDHECILSTITERLVDQYVDVGYNDSLASLSETDMIRLYASQVLSLGSLYLEFKDAIKEGDGLRVLRCYRYLLPIFKSSGRKNYSIESLNLLVQHDYTLSERQAHELIWSRFINTHGHPGRNIPNDLHCEHLNRLCKTAVKGLGANKTQQCITRVARAIGTIAPVLDNFDSDNGVIGHSSAHKVSNSDKDVKSVVTELLKNEVFQRIPGRYHPSFTKPRVPLHAKSEKEIVDWISTRINF